MYQSTHLSFFRRGERKVEAKNFFSTHSESNISLGLLPDLYFSLMQNFKSSVSGILVNSFSHVIPFSRCRWLQFLVERWGTDFLFLGNPGVLSLLVRFSPPHVSLVISYRPFDKSSIFCLPVCCLYLLCYMVLVGEKSPGQAIKQPRVQLLIPASLTTNKI